ncbi:M48 family metallopeptidase [Spongiibacter taiwanensis]|uniref:M48 family metallopeptidase n=1 Tax=Spongiibacter taiwanensis TaxID=1748242 RepID=UPI00203658D1|nr:SprT family zinc-dependent metalloprotease [Spongiibacter taiwanensis]USA44726.1 M48 family metallopeptidase [Spongiibacter taiwanensis]
MMVAIKPEYREANGFIAEVIRTERRKTADIRVEDGAVSVVVPGDLPVERIDSLLKEKRKWIKEKIALHRQAQPTSEKQFVSGEAFPYLGRNYRLKVEKGPFQPVRLINGRLVATVPEGKEQPHMIRNALVRWYKRQAEVKIVEKVERYSAAVGVEPAGVGIKSFKSRWGSCTAKGRLEFNWRIMMAPNRCVDYVVVHELCHLKRHDHSAEFWEEVGRILPSYEKSKEWLRDNGIHLLF